MPAEEQTWPPALIVSPIVGNLTSVLGRDCTRSTVKKIQKKNDRIIVFAADENYSILAALSDIAGVLIRHVRMPDVARYGRRSNVMRNADLLMRAVQSCGEVFLLVLQDSPSNRHLVRMCENKDLTIFDHRRDEGLISEITEDAPPRIPYDLNDFSSGDNEDDEDG